MRNEIAKQIINCRSGREGVAKILNSYVPEPTIPANQGVGSGIYLDGGNLAGETSAFAVATMNTTGYSASQLSQTNPLFDALNKTKVSRLYYQWTPDGWEGGDDFTAHVWKKNSSTGYQQVLAEYDWSEPVEELPEGAESQGEKEGVEPSADTLGQWYEETTGEGEAEETLYYQVIVSDLYWGVEPEILEELELPEDTMCLNYEQWNSAGGEEAELKESSALAEENIDAWFYDPSAIQKRLQDMILNPNPINTSLVYKQLDVAQEDIDDLNDSGEYSEFLDWVRFELRRNVEEYVIASMLGTVDPIDGIYSFNPETADDMFTTIYYTDGNIDLDDIISANSDVITDYKWLVINPITLETILADTGLKDKYELAGRLNVDYVYVTYSISPDNAVILDPNKFWMREKSVLDVAYPVYQNNKVTFLYEKNIGIVPSFPYCSALVCPALE